MVMRVLDHKVDFEGDGRMFFAVLDEFRSEGEVGDEVVIHDVEMEDISGCVLEGEDFFF